MFEDIIGEEKKITPTNKINMIDSQEELERACCKNCLHGSHILSNYPNKVLCQKQKRHKDFTYVCRNWERIK